MSNHTLLRIGYREFLLPPGVDGSCVIQILSQAMACDFNQWSNTVTLGGVLGDNPVNLELVVLNKKTKFVTKEEDGSEKPLKQAQKPKPKPQKATTIPTVVAHPVDQPDRPPPPKKLALPAPDGLALPAPRIFRLTG